MKRLWHFFSRMDLGFWLLLCVSLNLFIGALITIFHDPEFQKLSSMLMPAWVRSVSSRPGLYLWIVTLFILLLLLAVNTVVCTSVYVKTVMRKDHRAKKLGILLFHIAFVIALGGHCMSEFIGLNELVILDESKIVQVPGTDLSLETLSIRKISSTYNGSKVRMGTEATLNARTSAGNSEPMSLKTMSPHLSLGYTFHLSFFEQGLTHNQARLIVRRDYGLLLIVLAGFIAFIAIALYVPATLWPRRYADNNQVRTEK